MSTDLLSPGTVELTAATERAQEVDPEEEGKQLQ